jgi:GR25 family glycosyltransferase involved in LPS biosynthesis
MQNINTYFDKVYVLNLTRHKDRWEKVKSRLDKVGITNYIRFDGFDGSVNPTLQQWTEYSKKPFDEIEQKYGRKKIASAGALGNLKSITAILKDAKNKKYKKILLLEDDVYFHKKINDLFHDTIKGIPTWKLLYFGANDPYAKTLAVNKLKYYGCSKSTCGSFAVAIDSSAYDDILREAEKIDWPIDSGALVSVIKKYNNECFTLSPNLIICDVAVSTIRKGRNMTEFAKRVNWDLSLYDIN